MGIWIPESPNLFSLIMRIFSFANFHYKIHAEEAKSQSLFEVWSIVWSLSHKCGDHWPGDQVTPHRWHSTLGHDDMMTLTLRILLVVLAILYISYLNTQINSQDKSTSATNVSLNEIKIEKEMLFIGSGYWRWDETKERAGCKDMQEVREQT